jgi:hypothetical protein
MMDNRFETVFPPSTRVIEGGTMSDVYLSSKQAAEVLCEKGRTDFLSNVFVCGIIASILTVLFFSFLRLFTPFTPGYKIFIYSYAILTGYLLLLGIASVIMHSRKDGKYWSIFTFQPSWYNWVTLFSTKMVAVEDIGNIQDYSRKWILINGAQLSDLFCEGKKSYQSDTDAGYEYMWTVKVHLNGKSCYGSFKNLHEETDISFKQGHSLLIIGKVSGSVIKELQTADALKSNTEYNQKELQNIIWFEYIKRIDKNGNTIFN